jgi:hypothetical protein
VETDDARSGFDVAIGDPVGEPAPSVAKISQIKLSAGESTLLNQNATELIAVTPPVVVKLWPHLVELAELPMILPGLMDEVVIINGATLPSPLNGPTGATAVDMPVMVTGRAITR